MRIRAAPRDGRFIEKIGFYNPLLPKDHADRLKLDLEKAKAWMAKGATAIGPRASLPRRCGRGEAAGEEQSRKGQAEEEGAGTRRGAGRRCCRRSCRGKAAGELQRCRADILLGAVIGAQGLKGEVKVKTFTQSPEKLGAYGPLHDQGRPHVHRFALRAVKADEAVVRLQRSPTAMRRRR